MYERQVYIVETKAFVESIANSSDDALLVVKVRTSSAVDDARII